MTLITIWTQDSDGDKHATLVYNTWSTSRVTRGVWPSAQTDRSQFSRHHTSIAVAQYCTTHALNHTKADCFLWPWGWSHLTHKVVFVQDWCCCTTARHSPKQLLAVHLSSIIDFSIYTIHSSSSAISFQHPLTDSVFEF